MLDEGVDLILGQHCIFLPGERPGEQALSDSHLVELIVAGEANTSDLDKNGETSAQPPTMNYSGVNSMMNVLTNHCQWQDCVTADDLNHSCLQATFFFFDVLSFAGG